MADEPGNLVMVNNPDLVGLEQGCRRALAATDLVADFLDDIEGFHWSELSCALKMPVTGAVAQVDLACNPFFRCVHLPVRQIHANPLRQSGRPRHRDWRAAPGLFVPLAA